MKKILIYGMGSTGKEVVKFCKKRKIDFFTFDDNKNNEKDFKKILKETKEIITSPGVGLRNKNLRFAISLGIKVISEIEYASRFITKPVIAITGTNGKTTTTMLTYELLKSYGYTIFLGGNIGTPLIKALENEKKYDFLLLEVSSFQLQFIDKNFRPRISVILNISENHLDHHFNMKEYSNAKKNICKNQKKGDYLIINKNLEIKKSTLSSKIYINKNNKISSTKNNINVCGFDIKIDKLNIIGPHNIENIIFSLNIINLLNKITMKQIRVIKKFIPPLHRMEKLNTKRLIFNDSKSTSPQATEVAINSFDKGIILIMGGKHKNLEYSSLKKLINNKVKFLILYGENKFELAKILNVKNSYIASNLYDAVNYGLNKSNPKNVLLFSPGTSSFDEFKSFAQRGETFKKYVQQLS